MTLDNEDALCWVLGPSKDQGGLYHITTWETSDGNYQLAFLTSTTTIETDKKPWRASVWKEPGDGIAPYYDHVETDPAHKSGNYCRHYASIGDALKAVEKHSGSVSVNTAALLERVLQELPGVNVSVEDSEMATTETTKAPKKKASAESNGKERDRWGGLANSQGSKINKAVESLGGATFEEIAKECGLPVERVKSHVKYWLKHPGKIPFIFNEEKGTVKMGKAVRKEAESNGNN